jgi:hypothetical protein
MDSVKLTPAMFDFSHLHWMRHELTITSQSVTAEANKTAIIAVQL